MKAATSFNYFFFNTEKLFRSFINIRLVPYYLFYFCWLLFNFIYLYILFLLIDWLIDVEINHFKPFFLPAPPTSFIRYGMAHVYFSQENYRAAETYAEKVLAINGCSSIACTQMGLVRRGIAGMTWNWRASCVGEWSTDHCLLHYVWALIGRVTQD